MLQKLVALGHLQEDAEANDRIHMGSDHGNVMAQFVIPAPKKKDSQNGFKKMEEKLSNGEHQKSDEGRSEDPKKLPGSRRATVNLKKKSCRELKPEQAGQRRSRSNQ